MMVDYGGSDGSITTLIEGGIPPYFYQWTKNGVNFSTEKDLINIPVGEYSLKAWSTIKDLSEFTVEEKCKKFDNFYNSAMSTIKRVQEEEYLSEDEDEYSFEEIMNVVVREGKHDEFWKWFSGLYNCDI